MLSHETKRILGISGLLLFLIVVLAGYLPFNGTGPWTITRVPVPIRGPGRGLIFDNKFSFSSERPSFDQGMALEKGYTYMWRFNATAGSITANLTDPFDDVVYWSVGPGSSDNWRLNGIGIVSFNWTAQVSSTYSFVVEGRDLAQQSTLSGASPPTVCEVQIWEFYPLTAAFSRYA